MKKYNFCTSDRYMKEYSFYTSSRCIGKSLVYKYLNGYNLTDKQIIKAKEIINRISIPIGAILWGRII